MTNETDTETAVRIALLEQKVESLTKKVDEGVVEIKKISEILNFAKGGWKIGLVFTAGLVGLIDLGTKLFMGFFKG